MKSTPVSAPPARPVEVPNPEDAAQALNRAPVEANGPSRIPSRLPKARRWSKRAKILLALAITLFVVGSVGGAGYILVAKPFRDARTDLITHQVGYDQPELT